MKGKWIQTAFGLAALVSVLGFVYFVSHKVWTIFSLLNPAIAASIVAASATIIVSVISVRISKHLEQKALVIKEHREKKVPAYEKMIKFIFRIAFAEKLGHEKMTEKEMTEFLVEFTQDIVIWGSDELIEAFYKFRQASILLEAQEESNNIRSGLKTTL